MGRALGLRLSVAKAEDEAAERGVKVLGRAVWRREHIKRQPEADHTASPLRRHPTCTWRQPSLQYDSTSGFKQYGGSLAVVTVNILASATSIM